MMVMIDYRFRRVPMRAIAAVLRLWRTPLAAFGSLLLTPGPAAAAFLAGEALDTAADVLSILVLIIVPIGGIVLFWLVHILPEKIAEKKHHPQAAAIKTLCLLSLVFGGLLWPIAWLWAYTKPVLYKMAYGTDKGEDHEPAEAEAGDAAELRKEVARLRRKVDALAASDGEPVEVEAIRGQLGALESRLEEPRPHVKAG